MYKAKIKDKEVTVEFKDREKTQVILNGEASDLDMIHESENRLHLIHNNKSYTVELLDRDALTGMSSLVVNGKRYEVELKDDYDLLLDRLGLDLTAASKVNELKAPMPGLVLRTLVEPGDEVKAGDSLLVLEAMKMENVLKAPADAKVKSLGVEKGQAVEKNEILIHFE